MKVSGSEETMQNPKKPVPVLDVQPIWKDPLIWFLLGLYFVSTSIMNFLPVTFPIFKRVFGSTLEQMGRIQVCYYGSAVVFTIGGGWFVGRMGYRRAIAIALAVIAASLVLIGSAQTYGVVLVGAFCFGLGVLSVAVTTASIIGEHFRAVRQRLFLLHGICGSAGSMTGPAAMGWWLANVERFGGSWRMGYFFTAALVGLLVLWPSLLRSKTLAGEGSDFKKAPSAAADFRFILCQPAMYMIFLLTTLHGLTEGGMISFVGQLYQKKLGVDAAEAAYFLSSHAAGFLVGRSLLSWITAHWKIPELIILSACATGGTLFFAATIVSSNYAWGLVFMGLAGVFVSGNGPSINSYLGMRFAEQAKTAFSLMSGISYIGGAGGPYLVGYLGSQYGLEKSMWIDPLFSLSLATVALLWFLRGKSGGSWEAPQRVATDTSEVSSR